MKPLIPAALIALALSGCQTPRVETVLPPANLLTCADEPDALSLDTVDWTSVETARPIQAARDQALLTYVLAFRLAHGDCASKLAGVKAWAEAVE